MEFNPDEYLAEKEKQFDPDEYLKSKKDAEPESFFKSFVRETKGAFPMAGSVAGGAIGSTVAGAPTMGTALIPAYLTGSAAGAALGKGIENLIDQYYLEEPNPTAIEDVAKAPVYDVIGNITGEKLVAPVMNLAAKGATKVASSLSGIPEQVINSYAQHYTDVNRIDDIVNEADRIRQAAQDKIKNFKTTQNAKIRDSLMSKGSQQVDISAVRKTLESVKKRIDPTINPEWHNRLQKEIDIYDKIVDRPIEDAAAVQKYLSDLDLYEKEVARAKLNNEPVQMDLPELPTRPQQGFNPARGDDLLPTAQNMALQQRSKNMSLDRMTPENQLDFGATSNMFPEPPAFKYGTVSADQAHQLAQRLQNLADYTADGQMLKKKDLVDVVLSKAAEKARKAVQTVAPEISMANKELSSLHRVGKNINKNLITPEKSMNAMLSVGSGTNPVMEKQVEKFSNVVGEDFLTRMQKLSAARSFSNPDLVSTLQTGRAALPFIAAGGVGGALGGGVMGGLAGLTSMGFTTPLGIKGVITASKLAQKSGFTPSRIVGETVQGLSPLALEYIQQQMPQPKPEQPTDRAERINQERKMLKGK